MEEFQSRNKRKQVSKSVKACETWRLIELHQREEDTNTNAETGGNNLNGFFFDLRDDEDSWFTLAVPPFDRMLVDAQCSTDGAIRHIEKKQSAPSS